MKMLMCVLFLCLSVLSAEVDPIQLLKESQEDRAKLVPAIQALTEAIGRAEAANDDAKASELSACLFWARKRLNIQEINALTEASPDAAKCSEEVVQKKVDTSQAQIWLSKADGYAEGQKDPLLKAIRYYEVANRFQGTTEGLKAMEKSLALMQEAKVTVQNGNSIVGPAEKGDGKLYVSSTPSGAQILVMQLNELRDTGAKTPSMIELPKGPVVVVLRKEKFEDTRVEAIVGDAISKSVITLEREKFDVDVIADEKLGDGWRVFVNGQAVLDKSDNYVLAPCTIRVPEGSVQISLAKEGFFDPTPIRVTVRAGQKTVAEVKGSPRVGTSAILRYFAQFREQENKKIVGTWTAKHPHWSGIIIFNQDGSLTSKNKYGTGSGKWSYDGKRILIKWDKWPPESLYQKSLTEFSNNGFVITK